MEPCDQLFGQVRRRQTSRKLPVDGLLITYMWSPITLSSFCVVAMIGFASSDNVSARWNHLSMERCSKNVLYYRDWVKNMWFGK